jgi:hypothetical protein
MRAAIRRRYGRARRDVQTFRAIDPHAQTKATRLGISPSEHATVVGEYPGLENERSTRAVPRYGHARGVRQAKAEYRAAWAALQDAYRAGSYAGHTAESLARSRTRIGEAERTVRAAEERLRTLGGKP